MPIKQTRIFAPYNVNFGDNWAENLIGRILIPLVNDFPNVDWFWFSRYDHALGEGNEDCDQNQIAGIYLNQENNHTRSLRFRYSIDDAELANFETRLDELVITNSCFKTDFRVWDHIADLGTCRHIGGIISDNRIKHRAERLIKLYEEISLLTMDVIYKDPSGEFHEEKNIATDIPQPPSSFATPHHLFCNITGASFPIVINTRLDVNNIYLECYTGWGKKSWNSWHGTSNQWTADIKLTALF